MLLDNLKVRVTGKRERGTNMVLELSILEAVSTPAAATVAPTPAPASAKSVVPATTPTRPNPYPGFKLLGTKEYEMDAVSAAGVQQGHEFNFAVKI
jgi:hypothetical protein